MNIKKITGIVLLVVLLLGILPIGTFANRIDATYSFETFEITNVPTSIAVSFYSDSLSRGFAWYTSEEVLDTLLYVAEGEHDSSFDFENNATRIIGTSEVRYGEESPAKKVRVHKAHIEHLKANTTYSYKLGGGNEFVYGQFSVGDTDVITAINFTDPQTKTPSKLNYWENCVKSAFDNFGDDLDFVIHNGDMFDSNLQISNYSYYYAWATSLSTLTKYSKSLPLVLASGNHEEDCGRLWTSSYDVDFAGTTSKGTSGYYSFDYGNVHFVVLAYIDVTSSDMTKELEWLEQDLAANMNNENTKWTIVSTHWGPYTTGDHGKDAKSKTLASKITPIFSKYHVDLVIEGHDHTYSKSTAYKWDAAGYRTYNARLTTEAKEEVLILNPKETVIGSKTYLDNTNGTYYVSCGSSGHRNDENSNYSRPDGGAYVSNPQLTIMGKTLYTTEFANEGDAATGTLRETAFGVLNVSGDVLTYDFYVALESGEIVMIDSLNLYKGSEESVTKINDFTSEIASVTVDNAKSIYESYCNLSLTEKALVADNELDKIKDMYQQSLLKNIDDVTVANSGEHSIVKLQFNDTQNGKASLRIVSNFDLDVKDVGVKFEYTDTLGNTKVIDKLAKEVYTLKVDENNTYSFGEVLASDYSGYLSALTITNVSLNNDASIKITPYTIDYSGNQVLYDALNLYIEDGLLGLAK